MLLTAILIQSSLWYIAAKRGLFDHKIVSSMQPFCEVTMAVSAFK
jgi:hypothetical protein